MKLNRTLGSFPNRIPRLRIACVAMAVLMAVVASLMHASPAKAADGDASDWTVGIPNPANTTIDLFDYWVTSQSANDRTPSGVVGDQAAASGWYTPAWGRPAQVANQGINENHALIFHGGAGGGHPQNAAADTFTEQIGDYGTPSQVWGPVVQGLVGNTLGEDGYPHLNGNYNYTNSDPFQTINHDNGGTVNWPPGPNNSFPNSFGRFNANGRTVDYNESLAYLFNPGMGTSGKQSFPDVNNLLSVDGEGFYIFDSSVLRATYNQSGNRFNLDDYATNPYSDNHTGFWPFDDQETSGVPYTTTDHNSHNDYLGMHMNMDFSQPNRGMVLNPQGEYVPMTFTFTGDDDVWVFIDGVLVGDVGGIHQPSSLQINFQTGEVLVNRNFGEHSYQVENERGPGNPEYVEATTIRAMYAAAGAEGITNWDGNTFAAGTYHTIDFYYLERGNNESNLEIRFNMINTADFTAHKALVSSEGMRLEHNKYEFELRGLQGVYRRDPNTGEVTVVDPDAPALKPEGAQNPDMEHPYNDVDRRYVENDDGSWSYFVNNSADGNVNFGNAYFGHIGDGVEIGDIFRYIIRESAAPEGVTPDERIYYMEARVAYDEVNGEYYLSKTYYADDTFTTRADATFASFVNLHGDISTYTPVFEVSKDLKQGEDRIPIEEGKFTFEAIDSGGNVVASCQASDGSGVAQAKLTLPTITPVDFEGIQGDKTFLFTIREVIPEGAVYNEETGAYVLNGITYDPKVIKAEITLHFDGVNISQVGNVIYLEGETPVDEPFFHNTVEPVKVTILKVWDDSAAGADAHLAHPEVTFRVVVGNDRAKYVGGEDAEDKSIAADETGTADDAARTVTWENLPALDAGGNPITYSVIEVEGVEGGYVAGEITRIDEDNAYAFTMTNTLKPLYLSIAKKAAALGRDPEPLVGAEFTLTQVDPESHEPIEEGYSESVTTAGDEGIATFGGDPALLPGTYRIVETGVPDGYQQSTTEWFVTIAPDGTATMDGNDVTYDSVTRTLSIEITNTELPELPATGGPGDLFLIVSGVALIVAAMTLLDWSGRRESQ